MALVLARRGLRVLVLERGRRLSFADEPRDPLANHRVSLKGHNTGPDANHPRVFEHPDGRAETVLPWEAAYHNNASAVGGGTLVYGAQAWRFLPEDFAMASLYGVPEGSSLVDWPIGYADLAPYYALAEDFYGVSGDPPLPMPPMPLTERGRRLRRAADQLGWATQSVPLLINTVERADRPACIHCSFCVGFQCPNGAKSGTQNTALPAAEATGNATVWAGADVLRLDLRDGRAHGLRVAHGGAVTDIEADRVIVAAGAIESARLLLLSGVENPHLGRHLQGHYYPGAWGLARESVYDGIGPGVTTATTRFNHGNPGIIGGAMLADDFIVLPSAFWLNYRQPAMPADHTGYRAWFRHAYPRLMEVKGPVHEIPSPDCRVTLDPEVRDGLGRPVARLSGVAHPETVRTATAMSSRAREWLEAAGVEHIYERPMARWLSAGQHQAGTCRMSEDPAAGVTDPGGRVHGYDNLWVADAGLHPTNGGFNPVLTVMANAWRVATALD